MLAASVLMSSGLTLSNVMGVSQVALLAFISVKLNEHSQALWWMAQSCETVAEKTNHMEMRMMYQNFLGHECVRQVHQWFFNYDAQVSDIYWLLDKVCSELGCFRMASLRRGLMSTLSCEALIIRYVRERIFAEHASGLEGSVRALASWDRFAEWRRTQEPSVVLRRLGQHDPLRDGELTRAIEDAVISDDGHQYFWSFRG